MVFEACMDQVTIRSATEADLPDLLEIYNDAILHTTASYDYEPHTLAMRRTWYDTKMAQGVPIFVAERQGRVIGFSSFGPFRAWAAYQYTVELSIYVAASDRGRGVGKQLMKPLIEAARAMNMHVMVAGIDATNEASLRLHRSFGFQEVAHFSQVGHKFGRWLDLKFLQLILDPCSDR
jgi:L-amino acid N-acyltransferase YncA